MSVTNMDADEVLRAMRERSRHIVRDHDEGTWREEMLTVLVVLADGMEGLLTSLHHIERHVCADAEYSVPEDTAVSDE